MGGAGAEHSSDGTEAVIPRGALRGGIHFRGHSHKPNLDSPKETNFAHDPSGRHGNRNPVPVPIVRTMWNEHGQV